MAVVASLSHYTVLFTLAALAFPHETLATHFTVFQDIGAHAVRGAGGHRDRGLLLGAGLVHRAARASCRRWPASRVPVPGCFGRGFGKGDEPRLAILLMYALCQGCLFIGGLSVGAGGSVERR